jgi:hypothetical protein
VSATQLSGILSYGIGELNRLDASSGAGVRAPADYDALHDVDTYDLQFSSPTNASRAWELQWSVSNATGNPQHDLALDVTFCPAATANCTPVATRLAYSDTATASWSLPAGEPAQLLYSRSSDASQVTTTASAYACLCIEPFFFEQGAMKVSVSALDREGWSPVQYTVRTALFISASVALSIGPNARVRHFDRRECLS